MSSHALESTSKERQSSSTTLEAVSEKYTRLTEVRDGLASDCNVAVRGSSNVWTSAEPLEQLIDPIDDELYNLGWLVAETPANTPDMIRKKAAILADLVEHDGSDLVSCLTRSLLRDICKN